MDRIRLWLWLSTVTGPNIGYCAHKGRNGYFKWLNNIAATCGITERWAEHPTTGRASDLDIDNPIRVANRYVLSGGL